MRTHYDVLQLQRNCSAEDIKKSFIRLSKLYHPDVNKDINAHKKFVQVNEAYSVLGKQDSRLKYDSTLGVEYDYSKYYTYTGNPRKVNVTSYDYIFVDNTYKGYNKAGPRNFFTSKWGAALFCCFLMVFGSGIQLIRESNFRRMKVQQTSIAYSEVKAKAKQLGKEEAILRFRQQYSKEPDTPK